MTTIRKDLEGKTAVVTGSTQGIGLVIARELAARGANVMFTGLFIGQNAEQDKSVFNAEFLKLKSEYPEQKMDALDGDITDKAVIKTLMEKAAALGNGTIDILVNNAGIHPPAVQKNLFYMSDDDVDALGKTIDVNLKSVLYATHAVKDYLPKDGGGKIINMSSVHGHVIPAGRIAYGAAKHGLTAFNASLAAEIAPLGHQSFNIAPAFVKTELALKPVRQKAEEIKNAFSWLTDEQAYQCAEAWRLQLQDGTWIEESAIAKMTGDLASGAVTAKSGSSVKMDNGKYISSADETGLVTFALPLEIAQKVIKEKGWNTPDAKLGKVETASRVAGTAGRAPE